MNKKTILPVVIAGMIAAPGAGSVARSVDLELVRKVCPGGYEAACLKGMGRKIPLPNTPIQTESPVTSGTSTAFSDFDTGWIK